MRILTIVEPGTDGVFRHVEALCNFLMSKGIDCDLVYSSKRSCPDLFILKERILANGGNVCDMNVGNSPSIGDISASLKILKSIVSKKPDLVHCHSSKAGALGRIVGSIFFPVTPIVYSPHAYYGLLGRSTIKTLIFDSIELFLSGRAFTLNISDDERNYGNRKLGVSPSQSTVLPHGVDTERFKPVSKDNRMKLREKYGIDQRAKIMGIIGRASPQKDYPTLYNAIRFALNKNPEMSFFQVSWGRGLGSIKMLADELKISKRITFSSYLDDVREFYGIVDGVIMTSKYEAGIPYVALEAISCGLPLIASDGIGIRELSSCRFRNVRIAQTKNPQAFSEAMTKWFLEDCCDDPHDRRLIENNFSSGAALGKIALLYEFLLTASQKRATDSASC